MTGSSPRSGRYTLPAKRIESLIDTCTAWAAFPTGYTRDAFITDIATPGGFPTCA